MVRALKRREIILVWRTRQHQPHLECESFGRASSYWTASTTRLPVPSCQTFYTDCATLGFTHTIFDLISHPAFSPVVQCFGLSRMPSTMSSVSVLRPQTYLLLRLTNISQGDRRKLDFRELGIYTRTNAIMAHEESSSQKSGCL